MSKDAVFRYFTVFLFGAALYALIEVMWRSYTHWSMAITGGICMSAIYYIHLHCRSVSIWSRALMGCAAITLAEFIAGLIVNLTFHLNVWDYSGLPFNFMGQICLIYCALWYGMCFPAFFVCSFLEAKLFTKLGLKKREKSDKIYK